MLDAQTEVFRARLYHRTQPGEFNFQNAISQFVFAPEERNVYSNEHNPKVLAPSGAKAARVMKDDCAPPELKSKERMAGYKHLAPPGRSK
jgi:hypothetical protein